MTTGTVFVLRLNSDKLWQKHLILLKLHSHWNHSVQLIALHKRVINEESFGLQKSRIEMENGNCLERYSQAVDNRQAEALKESRNIRTRSHSAEIKSRKLRNGANRPQSVFVRLRSPGESNFEFKKIQPSMLTVGHTRHLISISES